MFFLFLRDRLNIFIIVQFLTREDQEHSETFQADKIILNYSNPTALPKLEYQVPQNIVTSIVEFCTTSVKYIFDNNPKLSPL